MSISNQQNVEAAVYGPSGLSVGRRERESGSGVSGGLTISAAAVGRLYRRLSEVGLRRDRVDADRGAYYAALEIERVCRSTETPAEVVVVSGRVEPTAACEQFAGEAPLVQAGEIDQPEWATAEASHTWVEVSFVGTDARFVVDAFTPSQVTAKPTTEPRVYRQQEPRECPVGYIASERQRLSEMDVEQIPASPWEERPSIPPVEVRRETDSPGQSSRPRPADGGDVVTPQANTICQMEAREGFDRLPAGTVDCIITSPPYRLQRAYAGASAVYGGRDGCSHDWVEASLYTDTPIREEGGGGLSSEGTAEELRRERQRSVEHCADCGAFRGQLGHEVTVERFVEHLVEIFEKARRALSDDGSLWVNLGDSYDADQSVVAGELPGGPDSLKDAPDPKSLIGLPERFLVAMLEAGWICREKIIWEKSNPAPDGRAEQDRARTSHEHIFRFVKQAGYADTGNGPETTVLTTQTAEGVAGAIAPMPAEVPRRLLESSTTPDSETVVCDPFAGSGTVLEVAAERGNRYVGFDISTEAVSLARDRLTQYNADPETLTGQCSLSSFA